MELEKAGDCNNVSSISISMYQILIIFFSVVDVTIVTQDEIKRLKTYLAHRGNFTVVPGKQATGSSGRQDEKRRSAHRSPSQHMKDVIQIAVQDRYQTRQILKKKKYSGMGTHLPLLFSVNSLLK